MLAENRLFATLDPTSCWPRFPSDREIILTDTVGFIRELPKELKEAFRATLEELEAADLLVTVADASHAEVEAQVTAVSDILQEMQLGEIPRLLVLNKWDAVPDDEREALRCCFLKPSSFRPGARKDCPISPRPSCPRVRPGAGVWDGGSQVATDTAADAGEEMDDGEDEGRGGALPRTPPGGMMPPGPPR